MRRYPVLFCAKVAVDLDCAIALGQRFDLLTSKRGKTSQNPRLTAIAVEKQRSFFQLCIRSILQYEIHQVSRVGFGFQQYIVYRSENPAYFEKSQRPLQCDTSLQYPCLKDSLFSVDGVL